MEPDNTQQTPLDNQASQYDFLANQNQPSNKIFLVGNSTKSRVVLVIIGLVLLIAIISIVSNALSAESRRLTTNYKNMISEQQELIRVSGLGKISAVSPEAKNMTFSINLYFQDAIKHTTEAASGDDVSFGKRIPPGVANPKNDEILKKAQANKEYDRALITLLTGMLQSHRKTVKKVLDSSKNSKSQITLQKIDQNINTLLNAKDLGGYSDPAQQD